MRAGEVLGIELGLDAAGQAVIERRVEPRVAGQGDRIADRRIGFGPRDEAEPDAEPVGDVVAIPQ
jgi:hypothetical protein